MPREELAGLDMVTLRQGTYASGRERTMTMLLYIVAVFLVIAGIVTMLRGPMLFGIVLIVLGLLIGPGGVSLFT